MVCVGGLTVTPNLRHVHGQSCRWWHRKTQSHIVGFLATLCCSNLILFYVYCGNCCNNILPHYQPLHPCKSYKCTSGNTVYPLSLNRLNSFFWVIARRLNWMCRRFGILCSISTGLWTRRITRPTNQQTNQPTEELTEGGDLLESAHRRPSICLAIPALAASLGSVTDTLNVNWDSAYANDLLSRLKTPTWATEDHCSRGNKLYRGGGITLAVRLSGIRAQNDHVES